MNTAEEFVAEICGGTFLSLWGFPNPLGKKGKELCDFLVISDPYIIIFSVKHIQIKDSGNDELDTERWHKNAIENSVKQIYGAERYINSANEIILKDRSSVALLPEKSKRIVHRVAVAIGRGEKYPLSQGDFDKGFVHVFDEKSFFLILKELDTINDFVEYLSAKVKFITNRTIVFHAEENLLGHYIYNGRTFPENADYIIFESDIWPELAKNKQYIQKKQLDDVSYIWDGLIRHLFETFSSSIYTNISKTSDLEIALRTMAKENRLHRRALSIYFQEFVSVKREDNQFAVRLIKSVSNPEIAYLFLVGSMDRRDERRKALELRCFVARGLYKEFKTVVGIATEPYTPNNGFSLDFCSIEILEWTDELDLEAKKTQEELGYFKNATFQYKTTNEYP